jgi:hypothetical protein
MIDELRYKLLLPSTDVQKFITCRWNKKHICHEFCASDAMLNRWTKADYDLTYIVTQWYMAYTTKCANRRVFTSKRRTAYGSSVVKCVKDCYVCIYYSSSGKNDYCISLVNLYICMFCLISWDVDLHRCL